jgi:Fe-S-cluster containining protein
MKLKKEDITFTCEKCGQCCRVDGFVYLKKEDEKKMAAYLDLSLGEFRKKFTDFLFLLGRVIKLDPDGCCFLVDGKCIIYKARPEQCRIYPWWPRALSSKKEWDHISTYCPGAKKAVFKTKENKR